MIISFKDIMIDTENITEDDKYLLAWYSSPFYSVSARDVWVDETNRKLSFVVELDKKAEIDLLTEQLNEQYITQEEFEYELGRVERFGDEREIHISF